MRSTFGFLNDYDDLPGVVGSTCNVQNEVKLQLEWHCVGMLTIQRKYMEVFDWRNIRGAMADSHELKKSFVTPIFAKLSRYGLPFLLPGNGVY